MSVLVYQDKAIALAVGVDWSVLAGGNEKANASAVRRRASMIGATKHCLTRLHDTTHIGLYTAPVALPGAKTPKSKGVHSLGIVFRNAFSSVEPSAVNAVLLMTPQDARDAKRLVLVVLEGGQVVYNKLDDASKAIDKAREFTSSSGIAYSIFGNTQDLAATDAIQWDELRAFANATSELKPIPANRVAFGILGLVTALVAAAVAYNYFVLAPAKARAKLLAQQAANNHTPQYTDKLNADLSKAGWQHADMLSFINGLKTQAVYHKGWELIKIECAIETSACEYKYSRLGGTLKALIVEATDKTHIPEKTIGDSEAHFKQIIKPVSHSLMGVALPNPNEGNVTLRNQAQRLLNAGAIVTATENKPGPSDGIDMTKVDNAIVIKRGGFEFKTPYALSQTMFEQLPAHVVLRSFIVDFNVGGDKADNIKMTFKGHSYVK